MIKKLTLLNQLDGTPNQAEQGQWHQSLMAFSSGRV